MTMSHGADADAPPTNTFDAPFEWLTNFKSLRHLVLPSRIAFGSSQSEPTDNCRDASASGGASERTTVQLNALHVGCGTSTVGEALLSLRERSRNDTLQYGHVVNVDNDKYALESMRRRWEKRKPRRGDADDVHQSETIGAMEWKWLDFKDEGSCRSALDGVHRRLSQYQRTTSDDPPGGCFDLVLDKSTLDCLLCAETDIVAQFLHEVYRALRVPASTGSDPSMVDAGQSTATGVSSPSSWGGIYVLVTFHPGEFVERLLTQLPGADWHVEHEVIKREVEDVNEDGDWELDEVTHRPMKNAPDLNDENDVDPPGTSAWSSGTFNPDDNYRKTVTVFTCRRRCTPIADGETSQLQTYILDRERVREHIERTCDDWYRTTNPMMTRDREERLRDSFSKAAAEKMNVQRVTDGDRELASDDVVIDLKRCYDLLFTDAEKEHLTYEYFLEDWGAYCERMGKDDAIQSRAGMTVSVALDFLKEMQ